MPELAGWTATQVRTAYTSRQASPVEVAEDIRTVIDAGEPTINAFWQRADDEEILAQARASEGRWATGTPLGPLDGIPVTIKENVARAGIPMPAGCAGTEPRIPDADAPATARILESGGVVLGSTVMPDWGMLSSGVSSRHGITRSPWDPAWTTGGSSSGAGAAAAAGFGPLHVGTDIGGSIRLPGTWLGLPTLKPSAGRVPLDRPYLGRVAGPMARSVADLALFLQVLARPDARDWMSLPAPSTDWYADLASLVDGTGGLGSGGDALAGLRVGVQVDPGCGLPVDPDVAATVEVVADAAAGAGARLERVGPWLTDRLLEDLDLFWRVRSLVDFHALPADRQERVLPFIRRWVSAGADASGERLLGCYASIMTIQERTVAVTEEFDIVLSPVAPMVAFPAEWPMPWGEGDLGMAHIGFTVPYNMSGQPAGSVNAGFTGAGKPIGVQVAGRRWDDVGVLRFMAWWESARPDLVPRWPIPT